MTFEPLAERLRPKSLDEYIGQKHLVGEGCILRKMIESGHISSFILWGPPGVGKTTLAKIIASQVQAPFYTLSAVHSGVKDVRDVLTLCKRDASSMFSQHRPILFIDEIHRFSRSQQDSLLPDVENGNVRLIGATTHNPQFYVIGALLSRSLAFQLRSLEEEDIVRILETARTDERAFPDKKIELAPEAAAFLAKVCEGDARRSLNAFEIAVLTTPVYL
jgi:putative ATPase